MLSPVEGTVVPRAGVRSYIRYPHTSLCECDPLLLASHGCGIAWQLPDQADAHRLALQQQGIPSKCWWQ